jgi:transcriptional regulator with PAS, ATPase and Fis domain
LGLNLFGGSSKKQAGDPKLEDDEMLPLVEVEKRYIKRVLERLGGNRNAAAEVLQIHRTTLYKKIEAYELDQEE